MITRRTLLRSAACGFGYLAWAGLNGLAEAQQQLHFAPRAKRMIFLFMQGGPSQVDSFDYKPQLEKSDQQLVSFDDARTIANSGVRGSQHPVMKSPWSFSQHGKCGRFVSTLFPHIARHVDDLCFIHSMHTEGVAHGPATLFLHCGATNLVRPSIGSWVLYGLGSENDDLPGFISLAPSFGNGGPRNYGSAFLPAIYQGTPIGKAGQPIASMRNLSNELRNHESQKRQQQLLNSLNAQQRKQRGDDAELDAAIRSYELAGRMQASAPAVMDIAAETAATQTMYGIGEAATDQFGRQCLLARRLCEAGVRFVQVTYGDNTANPAWDQHSNLPKHAEHALAVDKPIAALLTDLKQRGLLEDTLVWWGSEFGRTPYAEKNGTGRDHNPNGFTVWLAGGGVKPGFAFGATDEFGHQATIDKVHMHDLHATILHLLGLDHERLTYRYAGRNFRLTDVHGRVVQAVLS